MQLDDDEDDEDTDEGVFAITAAISFHAHQVTPRF